MLRELLDIAKAVLEDVVSKTVLDGMKSKKNKKYAEKEIIIEYRTLIKIRKSVC